jgi:hypothetical protein
MERRNIDRVPSKLFVQIEGSNIDEIACTADISPDGCQLYSTEELPPGTRLHGRILLDGDHYVPFEGEVRWCRSIDGWTPGQIHSASLGVSFAEGTGTGAHSE